MQNEIPLIVLPLTPSCTISEFPYTLRPWLLFYLKKKKTILNDDVIYPVLYKEIEIPAQEWYQIRNMKNIKLW